MHRGKNTKQAVVCRRRYIFDWGPARYIPALMYERNGLGFGTTFVNQTHATRCWRTTYFEKMECVLRRMVGFGNDLIRHLCETYKRNYVQ